MHLCVFAADEEELGAAGVGAHHELRTAPGDSLETIYDGKDEQQEEEAQDEEEQGEGVFADQGTKEEEGANQAQAVDESELRAEQTLNPRPGSGMMDEYLKRMHWSRSSPLPTPPSPPEDTPSRAAMPRRWSKTASVHGESMQVLMCITDLPSVTFYAKTAKASS